MTDISILVVNYNTAQLTKQCIESLLCQQQVDKEIIVVDNNSHDNSVALLRQFGDQIKLILNGDNKGFGRANNQAFQQSSGDYLFMLNPDARCLDVLDLERAVQFMKNNPRYGLVGTRIINRQNQLKHTAFLHYPRQDQCSVDFSHLPGKIATVLGASMLARRDVFAQIGGFDEDYFLYAEETDLCLRVRKAGYEIGYLEAVTVQHVGGASERTTQRAEVVRKRKRGKLLFYRKHYMKKDVDKIVRQDRRHAWVQMLVLGLKKRLLGLGAEEEARLARHRVSVELADEYFG